MSRDYSEQLKAMMPIADMLGQTIDCACGRKHSAQIEEVVIGRGAVEHLPELMNLHGYRSAFLMTDSNTHRVAGTKVNEVLMQAGFETVEHIYELQGEEWLVPDEKAMESAAEHYNESGKPDVIIAIGSGTVNDLGKVTAFMTGCQAQWVVATAASMDGYASNVSALVRNNLKVTEGYEPAKVIIGDTQFLCTAPRAMTLAGIADMAAKYNANMDWKLGQIINDEHYCEFIANGMLAVTDQVIDLGLEAPEAGAFSDEFYEKLMVGLVLSGVYMSYNQTSRPASGAEHHFSHFWEMWLQVNNKPAIYHGTKVGVGALIMAKMNQEFLTRDIEARRVIPRLRNFNVEDYKKTLTKVYGAAAPALLENYHYDAEERIHRLEIIVEKRRQINANIREMMPRLEKMKACLEHLGATLDWTGLKHITGEIALQALLYCKEMRKTYTMLQVMTDTGYHFQNFAPKMTHNGYLTLPQIQMRDPFVLPVPEEGKYYLFGTTSPNPWTGPDPGFDCFVSADLEKWEGPLPAFRPSEDFWGVNHFWAPEVHRYKDKFYMFATFEGKHGKKGTTILRSEKPAGPYVPLTNGPMTPMEWESLDGTFYLDPKGRPWMIFCHEWTQIMDGAICAMPLNKAMTAPAGEPVELFHASAASWSKSFDWKGDPEKRGYVTDGPFIIKQDGNGKEVLYMLWSTMGEEGYCNGSAYSENGILGPWIQNEQLAFSKDGGHGMVFHTFEGKTLMSVHQPNKHPYERPRFFEVKIEGKAVVSVEEETACEAEKNEEKEIMPRKKAVTVVEKTESVQETPVAEVVIETSVEEKVSTGSVKKAAREKKETAKAEVSCKEAKEMKENKGKKGYKKPGICQVNEELPIYLL